ncbi:MAG: VacJ family lipoprotein [Alphaproteobacteria bacterium]|nr:VacJ family lipoprotein [Alphaproteobacteria bacterium]
MKFSALIFFGASALALVLLAGCATRPPADDPEALQEFRENNDPFEPSNRVLFAVHEAIDQAVLQPMAEAYRDVLPPPVRAGIRNVLGNLRTTTILTGDLLQGNFDRARKTLGRFIVNTTIGIGGIQDVGRAYDVHGHSEDMGQTFAAWGVGEGFYIFMPLLGPSTARDLVGFGADIVSNPFTWIGQGQILDAWNYMRLGMTIVDTREALLEPIDAVRKTSLDPYATLRSAYRQRRAFEIQNKDSPAGAVAPAGGVGFGQGITESR